MAIPRLNILLNYPLSGRFMGFPWVGLYVQKPLPAIGEEIPVIILDRPGKTFTAKVVSVNKTRWFYTCQLDPDGIMSK